MSDRSTQTAVGRRRFLGMGCAAVAGASLTACAGDAASAPGDRPLVTDRPSFTYAAGTSVANQTAGETSVAEKALVAYATRTGSTIGVASAIGEALAGKGYAVDVKPIAENPPTAGYQAVVLGSAVNGGQWLPEAVQFVKDNQQALGQTSVALFCVHIMNLGDDAGSERNRQAYLNAVRPLVKPLDEAFFAGLGPETAPTGIAGWLYRAFGGSGATGDCRDWAKIRGWAEGLPAKL
jgi:menaquinone-dependent protoporphyrinogen oxidase